MHDGMNRRTVMRGMLIAPLAVRPLRGLAQADQSRDTGFSYPIGLPDEVPGNGFLIRHGFTTENTWYLPGYWHTGEDWYGIDGDTAWAAVLAIGDGEVVFAGSEYPGRVVIVRHEEDLYSMYGHLDPALVGAEGDTVGRGQVLGSVLDRSDDIPNHLHFEIRSFLTTPEVNGTAPRYGFQCGPGCLPGPGYWPIDAPDLPIAQGWFNPTHVINARAFVTTGTAADPLGSVIVAREPSAAEIEAWSAPEGDRGAERRGTLSLEPGTSFPVLAVRTDEPDTAGTSADAYLVWYQIETPEIGAIWVRAIAPTAVETGGDGRSSAVMIDLLPVVPVVKR